MYLSDGAIGDEFFLPCCTPEWDYTVNPATEVAVAFNRERQLLQDGVYQYKRQQPDSLNDFTIRIWSEMVFAPFGEDGSELVSFEPIAENGNGAESFSVNEALIQIRLVQDRVQLDYIIDLLDQTRVVGSFDGPLSGFIYNSCNADCD